MCRGVTLHSGVAHAFNSVNTTTKVVFIITKVVFIERFLTLLVLYMVETLVVKPVYSWAVATHRAQVRRTARGIINQKHDRFSAEHRTKDNTLKKSVSPDKFTVHCKLRHKTQNEALSLDAKRRKVRVLVLPFSTEHMACALTKQQPRTEPAREVLPRCYRSCDRASERRRYRDFGARPRRRHREPRSPWRAPRCPYQDEA